MTSTPEQGNAESLVESDEGAVVEPAEFPSDTSDESAPVEIDERPVAETDERPVAEADERLVAAHDQARAALLEITSEWTVGAPAGYTLEEGGVVSLRFENRLAGYPGWFWTVSVARVEGEDPTVLEVELLPGDGALLAPEWVPWAVRLADYQAAQLAHAGDVAEGLDDGEDEDGDDLDDIDDLDAADFDNDGSPILHAGDVDGVDIDEFAEQTDAGEFEDAEGSEAAEFDDDDDADDDDEADDDEPTTTTKPTTRTKPNVPTRGLSRSVPRTRGRATASRRPMQARRPSRRNPHGAGRPRVRTAQPEARIPLARRSGAPEHRRSSIPMPAR